MPTSQDYVDNHNEEGYDDDNDYKPTPCHTMTSTPRPKSSLGGHDDAGLNAMLGNLAISTCSAMGVATCQNSRGSADADAAPHDSHALYSLAAKFANGYALNPDNQVTHLSHLHAFCVDGCKVKDANTKIDKLVVMMQAANPDISKYGTGKLSDSKKF
jgi:hypothetical protein